MLFVLFLDKDSIDYNDDNSIVLLDVRISLRSRSGFVKELVPSKFMSSKLIVT